LAEASADTPPSATKALEPRIECIDASQADTDGVGCRVGGSGLIVEAVEAIC
jgi:hypothetical protein